MLLRFDPFRELDRVTESALGRPPRCRWTPSAGARRWSSPSTSRASIRRAST